MVEVNFAEQRKPRPGTFQIKVTFESPVTFEMEGDDFYIENDEGEALTGADITLEHVLNHVQDTYSNAADFIREEVYDPIEVFLRTPVTVEITQVEK